MCSFSLTAARGRSVLPVNCISPVPPRLLMRGRVWLAESSSLAHQEQSSLGRRESSHLFLHMIPSMDASLVSSSSSSSSSWFYLQFCPVALPPSSLYVFSSIPPSCLAFSTSLPLILTSLWSSCVRPSVRLWPRVCVCRAWFSYVLSHLSGTLLMAEISCLEVSDVIYFLSFI